MSSVTKQEAAARAELVSVGGYDIDFDLTLGAERFRTTTTVRFTARDPGGATFVELRPVALQSALLNGAELDPASLVAGRLGLTELQTDNELVVTAEFAYSRSSEGVHRFVDPADDEIYIYAQPAIAQAPSFMACFDQPDLKAPVTVRVRADPGWSVRGNGTPIQLAPGYWQVGTTVPIATYLITMAAGPWHEVHREHDNIPLALFARASLAADLDREAAELFEITTACLDHFHELFGVRYPFGAYDQVFVPEFSWGAMEFPGCVLIRDELVFRSAVTDTERQGRAVLIAHEMAHMWFGNLVTMRWWDDLWLNESFADYLGWRVVAEATRFRQAWTSYSVLRKTWGYVADQRPSTHPVAPQDVPDTDAALANFDGISYAKGSAVLRQLVAWVGDEAFRSGLRDYFHTHAYANATLDDLLMALSKASGRDLTEWTRVWLREPQVNTLRTQAQVGADGRYTQVQVIQHAPAEYPVLRPHRMRLAVYDKTEAGVARRQQVPVEIDGARVEVSALADQPAGALLLVNDEDMTYAKIRVDADLSGLLPQVSDPLTRALLWTSAWDACRDGELAPQLFVTLAASTLPVESQVPVFETMCAITTDVVVPRYLAPAQRPAAAAALAAACRAVLDQAPPASDRQLAAARGLLACAGDQDVEWMSAWLAGSGVPHGLAIDAELRWLLLRRLAAFGATDSQRIQAEAERDRSARGVQEATRCRAALPDLAAKEQAWQLITADRQQSNRVVVAAAEGFWQPQQSELTAWYVSRYFDEISAGAQWRTEQMLAAVARAAYPAQEVTPATLAAAQEFLGRSKLHPVLRRTVLDATDDLSRALRARQLTQ